MKRRQPTLSLRLRTGEFTHLACSTANATAFISGIGNPFRCKSRPQAALALGFSWIGRKLPSAFDLHFVPIVNELLAANQAGDMDSAAFTCHGKRCPLMR